MKSIDEERRDAARRMGRPVNIYNAYPHIGRGFVRHNDTVSHEEINDRYERAERGAFGYYLHRLKERILTRHA